MNDDMIPVFIKKVNVLIMLAEDPSKHGELLKTLIKLRQWLIGDRSVLEHRMFQAFLTFMYSSYGDLFESRDGYKDWLLHHAGHSNVQTKETTVEGVRMIHTKYEVKSLAFGSCSQKVHHAVVEKVFEFCENQYPGFSVAQWKQTWMEGENLM